MQHFTVLSGALSAGIITSSVELICLNIRQEYFPKSSEELGDTLYSHTRF